MSDFQYQLIIRKEIKDLHRSAQDPFADWTEWETEFIESMALKLDFPTITLSVKQSEKLRDLHERL